MRGRPRSYDPDKLLSPLKAIWLAALHPCGLRLHTCLPDCLHDYEADHRRLDPDGRQALLWAKCATLDRRFEDYLPDLQAEQERVSGQVVRRYGPAQTPLAQVLACAEAGEATMPRLRAERAGLNALALRREVDRRLQEIEAVRRWTRP